jgi:sarcosine oxidase
MMRLAHFEHPWLVPLAAAAWDRWRALEQETSSAILTETGGLYAGPTGSTIVEGARESAASLGLAYEVMDAAEMHARWPIFQPPDDTAAVLEAKAGVLRTDLAIAAHLRAAEAAGADLRFDHRIVGWRPTPGGGFEVEAADQTVVGADHLVLTTGPWIGEFVPELRLPLVIEREAVAWFEPRVPVGPLRDDAFPFWVFATVEDGAMYGIPYDDELGLKISRHHWGVFVDPETSTGRSHQPTRRGSGHSSVATCLMRTGRSGHRPSASTRTPRTRRSLSIDTQGRRVWRSPPRALATVSSSRR